MASADPVERLDQLLRDDPSAPGIDELMTVAGDLLLSRGERIRGELLVLELGLRHTEDLDARRARKAALARWLAEHRSAVLGRNLAAMYQRPGALRPRFHGGRLWALAVDLRRLPVGEDTELSFAELVPLLLRAPQLRGLQRLEIRTRHDADVPAVAKLILAERKQLPALEQLQISMSTRPQGHLHRIDPKLRLRLREAFPLLWLACERQLLPLLEAKLADHSSARALDRFAGAAMNRERRVHIGRALTSGRPETTLAACEQLARVGPSAQVFAPTLATLMQPQVSHALPWILPTLAQLGPWRAALRPALARITGSSARYGLELRSLAGKALAQL